MTIWSGAARRGPPAVVGLVIAVVVAPRVAAAPQRKLDLAPLVAAVNGPDLEAAVRAANALGSAAEPAAHEALLDALALGPPVEVAEIAIDALARHPAPLDVAALSRYASHHTAGVRVAALAAIATYPDPIARGVVVAGLHDPVANVRAAAAAAAGVGRVREAQDTLFALLAKDEAPAALALAALADADLARKIADHFGQVPEVALATSLGAILKRVDFGPDTARVEVVRALGKIADPAALHALTDYIDAAPKNPPRPSVAEAMKLVQAKLEGGS